MNEVLGVITENRVYRLRGSFQETTQDIVLKGKLLDYKMLLLFVSRKTDISATEGQLTGKFLDLNNGKKPFRGLP